MQPSSERGRGKVPKDGEINPSIGNRSPKTPPLLPSSYHRNLNRISNESSAIKTRDLWKIDEVGHRAERVRHQIQTKNSNKRADLGRLRHGIHLSRVCRSYSTDVRPRRLSVDGTTNAQGSGASLILTSPDGIDIEYALRFGFRASNNDAEYEVVIAGLNLAHSMEVDQLEVCSDSQVVVKQIEDFYEARGEKMILYLKKVRELLKKFVRVQIIHIPRAENSRADALAKLATASQEDLNRLTPVEHLSEPSVDLNNEEISPIMSELSWMDTIWVYLMEGLLPNEPNEASKLRSRSSKFTIHRGTFYKRGFFTPILKCIARKDANYVLREVHEGICGNHIGARALAGKVLRQGYYWPTMLRDATELVKKCKVC